jgi:hypothetical protein
MHPLLCLPPLVLPAGHARLRSYHSINGHRWPLLVLFGPNGLRARRAAGFLMMAVGSPAT